MSGRRIARYLAFHVLNVAFSVALVSVAVVCTLSHKLKERQ